MLNLILGGSGSGKTALIEEKIKKNIEKGEKVILLVPEQETVTSERRMLELLPPSAQLNFEVLNFSRLANRVFRQYGGLSYRNVSRGVKALTMWSTVTSLRPLLSMYGGGENSDLSLTALMLSAVEEFKAYCISPGQLERAAGELSEESTLFGKLKDLSLIYAAYNASVESYGDGSEELTRLDSVLSENDFFSDIAVYIDSFTGFTEQEHRIISRMLGSAKDVTAAICFSDEIPLPMHLEATRKTVELLSREAEGLGVEIDVTWLRGNKRTESEALQLLERELWSFDRTAGAEDRRILEDESIKLVKCANSYEEAEAAACHIGGLVRNGAKYGEIAVIARNAGDWRGIIDHAFEKAGIPFYMSESTDVSAKPLIKLLLSALRIKNRGWSSEDVISYVKTGLCGGDTRDMDLFEDYIWRWSLSGKVFTGEDWTMNPYSYSGELRERELACLECVNRARRQITEPLTEFFAGLDSAETNADLARAVFDFMCALNIPAQLTEYAEFDAKRGMRREAAEAVTLYNSVIDILDIIAGFENDAERLSSVELEDALATVFSHVSVGAIPTSCDEVTVGSANMLRTDRPKYAVIIGMNDGVFPKNPDGMRLLTDGDRDELSKMGISLSPFGAQESAEELFYVYRAVTCPSRQLYASYSYAKLQGDGERLPSMAFNRIKLITGASVFDFSEAPIADRLLTPKLALEYAAMLGDSPEGMALRRALCEEGEIGGRYYRRILDSDIYSQSVSRETADEIFGDRISMSPSALERYVKCHFDYYCKYVLSLREDQKSEFRLSETGTLVHAVLEEFVRSVTDEHGFNAALAAEKLDTLPELLIEKYATERLPVSAQNERMRHTLKRLKRLSRVLAGNVVSEFQSSGFVPTFFEMKIGYGEGAEIKPSEYKAANGKTAVFGGIVDRVDLLRRGEDVYVKVVDYKTGDKEFKLSDVESGLNVQILLYLFSICFGHKENRARLVCTEGGRLIPAGAVYLSSKLGTIKESADMSEESIMKKADGQISRRGVVTGEGDIISKNGREDRCITLGNTDGGAMEAFSELEGQLRETVCGIVTSMTDGDASIHPVEMGTNPCTYCKMRAVCRRSAVFEYGEEEGENG